MKKSLILAVLGLLLAPTASVLAFEPSQADPVALCEDMVTRSQERYSANETRHADNKARLSASIEKLQEFVDKAGQAGVDTAALLVDTASVQAIQDEIEADYLAVQGNLSTMMQSDCSTMTIEENRESIATAKELFEALKADVATVKELRQTINSHMQTVMDGIQAILDAESTS